MQWHQGSGNPPFFETSRNPFRLKFSRELFLFSVSGGGGGAVVVAAVGGGVFVLTI